MLHLGHRLNYKTQAQVNNIQYDPLCFNIYNNLHIGFAQC